MQFNFEVEEMNAILAILAKQPFESVVSIIEKIRVQAMAQVAQQPAPTEADKDAE